MLLLLPILLLLAAALIIVVVQRLRPAFGAAWSVAVVSALLAWVGVLVLHWLSPTPLVITGWQPGGSELTGQLAFQLDLFSWPYAFSMASLQLAVILTAGARLQHRSNPGAWAGGLAITAISLLAVMAESPLAVLLSWTAIDVVELVLMLTSVDRPELTRGAVVAFSARAAGTALGMWAILISRAGGQPLTLAVIQPQAGVYLLLAAGLRLGILPLHLPYSEEAPMRRGLGTILRLSAPAAALVMLGRLGGAVISPQLTPWLLLISGLGVLYAAAMWVSAADELRGRPFWLIALAGMAVISVINGRADASLAWGVGMILTGSVLFLFSASARWVMFAPALALLLFSGLPFTPAAAGWRGLLTGSYGFLDVILLLALALLLLGFVRHSLRPREPLVLQERWIQVVYAIGLGLLNVAWIIISIWGWPGSLTLGVWWAALIPIVLAAGVVVGVRQLARFSELGSRWFVILGRRIWSGLAVVLRLDWLYSLFAWGYGLLQDLVRILTGILEGEGGVLWALVLLALLISLLRGGSGS